MDYPYSPANLQICFTNRTSLEKALLYRRGTTEDIPALKALGIAAFSTYKPILTKDNWHKMYTGISNDAMYASLLDISKCFVCTHEGSIIGMGYFIPSGNPTDIYLHNWSYVRMLGVHPEFGNRGIAHMLMQTCIDYARKSNESIVALHTSEFMDAGRHLYEKLGFERLKEIDPRFGKKYWLYTLELKY